MKKLTALMSLVSVACGGAVQAQPACDKPGVTIPVPLKETRTPPTYPLSSRRSGEVGRSEFRVTIGTDGVLTDVVLTKSSGSRMLDEAAATHIKANWRWTPAIVDCKPVEAKTLANIDWSLY